MQIQTRASAPRVGGGERTEMGGLRYIAMVCLLIGKSCGFITKIWRKKHALLVLYNK